MKGMAFNGIGNLRLVARVGIFLVVMMALGMAVMVALQGLTPSQDMFIVWIVLALLASLPLAIWLANWIIRPVAEIQSTVKQIAENWNPGVEPMSGETSSAALGRILNQLASRSHDRIQALEGERTKVAVILDSMVEGVIALDPQGRILLMNPSARRIFDLKKEQVEGQLLLEAIRHRGLAEMVEQCQSFIAGELCRREVEINMPVTRVLEVHGMPLPFTAQTWGILLVLHDITELRRLERVRAEFVANVSHELRTPLTAIKGYLETLLDEAPQEPRTHRRFLEVANSHAERLGRLLNDLLNLSDIETGKVVLDLRSVNVTELISEVSSIFEKDAKKKGVLLINHVSPQLEVHADRDRLSQILVNLIDNAVKYTPEGGQIMFESEPLPDGQTAVYVKDTGPGIPSKDLPRLTERFYRVDKARSRDEGGTGLGLAIVKHLVQLHGGSLHIDSEVGKGTTIQFILPASVLTHSL